MERRPVKRRPAPAYPQRRRSWTLGLIVVVGAVLGGCVNLTPPVGLGLGLGVHAVPGDMQAVETTPVVQPEQLAIPELEPEQLTIPELEPVVTIVPEIELHVLGDMPAIDGDLVELEPPPRPEPRIAGGMPSPRLDR